MRYIHAWLAIAVLASAGSQAQAQTKVVTEANLDLENRYEPAPVADDEFVQRRVRLPFTNDYTTLHVRKVGTRYIYQGDIIVDEEGFEVIAAGVEDQDDRWPNGTVPISIAADVRANADTLEALYDALNTVMVNTEIKFVPRDRQNDYVEVVFGPGVPGASAASRVGRVGGRQELVIHVPAPGAGVLVHELLHAVGLYHEQSRPDRDQFVDLDLSGLSDRQRANFDKVDAKNGGPYDYLSIMHYPDTAFSPNTPATPTIYCKTNNVRVPCPQGMGQLGAISTGDIAGLDAIYSEISRFSDGGWDASITRSVRSVPTVPLTGSFEWTRATGSPRQPNLGDGAVDYLSLQVLAPREMTVTWRGGVKTESYSNWRDSLAVTFRPLAINSVRSLLGFDANVPGTLPLILKAEILDRRWRAPPKPAACEMRVATCSGYWLGFDSASTSPLPSAAGAAPRTFTIVGSWTVGSPSSLVERGARTLTLEPLHRVTDKPLWSMKPAEGIFSIEVPTP